MKTWAILNQKGGSGKTSTAVNLAACLGELGKKTLVVDLDPQCSASAWLGFPGGENGILEVFEGRRDLGSLVRETKVAGVDLVPASPWLVGAEKAAASQPGAELVLRGTLRKLPKDRWDFCFLDCPPTLGLLAVSALAAAPNLLIPAEVSPMALAGIAKLLETVALVRERLNPSLEIGAVLACRVDTRQNLARDVLRVLQEKFPDRFMETVVRETVKIREASGFAEPITTYDSNGNGARDYRAVAQEFLERFQGGKDE